MTQRPRTRNADSAMIGFPSVPVIAHASPAGVVHLPRRSQRRVRGRGAGGRASGRLHHAGAGRALGVSLAGAIEHSVEVQLLIKTTPARLAALQARLLALHPYEMPEILALPVVAGHAPYLDWLDAQVTPPTP